MLLDDNCIRPDKIPDFGFPLVCQAEMSRYANIRADRTISTFFPPLPLKNSRSHEWHYGIISGWKLCGRLPYRKQLPTYLMNDAHALPSPFSISFPCGLDTRACIKFYLGINTFWREYQDSFPQTTVCGYIHYDVFLVQIHISMSRKDEIRTATL